MTPRPLPDAFPVRGENLRLLRFFARDKNLTMSASVFASRRAAAAAAAVETRALPAARRPSARRRRRERCRGRGSPRWLGRARVEGSGASDFHLLETPSPSRNLEVESGEDSASFRLSDQRARSWQAFAAILSASSALVYVCWMEGGLGARYVEAVEALAGNDETAAMLCLVFLFGLAHSGLAAFRPAGERVVGKRAYRVGFALASLPLALTTVMYFVNHRYSGVALFNLREVPGVHSFVWALSFLSFLFLYPSTFNILEVAAVDTPEMHLWETGVIRITRHPQMVGQVMWCVAHVAWTGNSFVLATSLALCLYHVFGCWHGDRRLEAKFGESFARVKERTSVLPFAAVLDRRQVLPRDYWREWARGPYLVVVLLTLGAYWAHPLMQVAAHQLKW